MLVCFVVVFTNQQQMLCMSKQDMWQACGKASICRCAMLLSSQSSDGGWSSARKTGGRRCLQRQAHLEPGSDTAPASRNVACLLVVVPPHQHYLLLLEAGQLCCGLHVHHWPQWAQQSTHSAFFAPSGKLVSAAAAGIATPAAVGARVQRYCTVCSA